MSDILNFYSNLVNESTNAIYVNDINTHELLYMNDTARKLLKQENVSYAGKKCYEYIFRRSSPCEFCKMDCMQKDSFLERDFLHPSQNIIYCLRGKLTSWNGVPAHVEYIQDVTSNRRMIAENIRLKIQAEDALKNYRALVDTVPGGIAQYEIIDGKVLTKFYSDGLCALSGYTRQERDDICKENAMALTYDEDVPYLEKALEDAIAYQSNLHLTYRMKTKSGPPCFVNLNATYALGKNGNPEFHAVFSDITEFKSMEESLQEQQLRYEIALKSSGINVWEYDIETDRLTVVSNSARIKQNCFAIENYIASTLANGYVREDSIEAFLSIFKRLRNGEKEIIEDIWYKTTDEAGFWCERVIYTTVFDENGRAIKAFGAGRDVTREKDAIKKFEEEMSYRVAMQEANIDSLKINLTRNTIVDGDSPFRVLSELIEGNNADVYFAKTPDYIVGQQSRETYRERFNRDTLLACFNRGDYSLSMEFARVFDTSKIYWIKYNVHLMRNPETKDIFAFVVATDITDEKVMQSIMQAVTKAEYDFFVVVDGSTNSASDYSATDKNHIFIEDDSFEEKNEALIRKCVCAEDVEMVVANCKIDNILKQTQNGQVYKFNFSMRDKNGEVRRKQLQFMMISAARKSFLMTRIDVNSVYKEEQIAKQRLEEALEAAKQASSIKTDFLARMSHDIRTPLNAIIGLSGLGTDSDSMDEMRDYYKQIEASGQYLLSIINDVLDMSKIESNNMVLRPTVVFLPQFIQDTIAIVKPAIIAKNIHFEVKKKDITSKYLQFDATHVRQVAVNLLSNAIKFTPNGGHVELCLENISRSGTMVRNRMTIRDNGEGISKEFLSKVFSPFEQENANDDASRKGTGLGLSIVKSIVNLMGGTIRVESEKWLGTAFIIEWDFEVASAEDIPVTKLEIAAQASDLKGCHLLLCEDHPLNAQIATKLLEKKAMIVDHAKNGQIGVEMFSASEPNYYDAILMDIRMPVMDGFEAVKQIRTLKRADSQTVPIIAMTANAFDEDVEKSVEAGMNAHLAKPIEPDKLFYTIEKLIVKERG